MEQLPRNDIRIVDEFDFEAFWQLHGRKVLIGVVAVAVVGAAAYIFQGKAASDAERASAAVSQATDATALENVLRAYPRTEAAAQALLKLAEQQYQAGKYADAASTYKRFVSEYPQHEFVQSALLGAASATEAAGDVAEAKSQYDRLAQTYAAGYAALPARIGSGRCAEALGQIKEARQTYEELLPAVQQTQWQPEVYLRWLALSRDAVPASPSTNSTPELPLTIPQAPVATPSGSTP